MGKTKAPGDFDFAEQPVERALDAVGAGDGDDGKGLFTAQGVLKRYHQCKGRIRQRGLALQALSEYAAGQVFHQVAAEVAHGAALGYVALIGDLDKS